MRVPHGSTVVVADGAKRLIARNEGDAETLNLQVVEAAQEATPRTSEIETDHAGKQPARNPGTQGGGGGAPSETNDPHQNLKDDFARETAELLRRGVEDGSYEQLVIVAAPRTLGELRKHYHKTVADRIIGELSKDVTGQPIDQIEKLLLAH